MSHSGPLNRVPDIIFRRCEVSSSRRNTTVTKSALDFGKVCATLKHAPCKAVAQRMRSGLTQLLCKLDQLTGPIKRDCALCILF